MLLLTAIPSSATDNAPANRGDAFAAKLADQLRSNPGNLVFSPLSIRMVLEMTNAGARGKTASELSAALAEHDATATTQPDPLFAVDSPLKIANGLWIQQGVELNPQYQATARDRFHGEVAEADFQHAPDQASDRINRWVADNTANKISNLFPSGAIKRTDRVILVNAIYLKTRWLHPFDPKRTADAPFKIDGKSPATAVPMMHETLSAEWFEDQESETIVLPYADGDFEMVITLPKTDDGLGALEQSLAKAKDSDATRSPKMMRVELSLPRWKSATSIHLIPALQAMGIHDAFSSAADFSGISVTPLVIGDVVHQATIDVDESGTEAAAATGVRMRTLAMRPEKPHIFNVDHPFLYTLRSRKTGEIIFMGRVTDPRH